MTELRDLSPARELSVLEDVPVVHVGWLERSTGYLRGNVDARIRSQLKHLCLNSWQPLVRTDPDQWCGFCRENGQAEAVSFRHVFVPGTECVFFAPEAVVHYTESHSYCPPREFQDAVDHCPPLGSRAYLDKLAAHNWPRNSRFVGGEAVFVLSDACSDDIAAMLKNFGASRNHYGAWIYEIDATTDLIINTSFGLVNEALETELWAVEHHRRLDRILGRDSDCRLFAGAADGIRGALLRKLALVIFREFCGLVEFRQKNGLAWIWRDRDVRAGALR